MGDPQRRVRDYIMKNALQILISLLLSILIAIYVYHFKRLESLEGRVWALEQKQLDIDVVRTTVNERTASIQSQIDRLCQDVDSDLTRLEGMIIRLLNHNGLSMLQESPPTHKGG